MNHQQAAGVEKHTPTKSVKFDKGRTTAEELTVDIQGEKRIATPTNEEIAIQHSVPFKWK